MYETQGFLRMRNTIIKLKFQNTKRQIIIIKKRYIMLKLGM